MLNTYICSRCGVNAGPVSALVTSVYKFRLTDLKMMTKIMSMQKAAFSKMNTRSIFSNVCVFSSVNLRRDSANMYDLMIHSCQPSVPMKLLYIGLL